MVDGVVLDDGTRDLRRGSAAVGAEHINGRSLEQGDFESGQSELGSSKVAFSCAT